MRLDALKASLKCGSHSAASASHPSKDCNDRIQPGLLRKYHWPHGWAKEHLRNAIELDKDIRGLAIDDEDLKPSWDWIAGLE